MTYSVDLRKQALLHLDKEGNLQKTAEIFGVTTRSLANWIRRRKEDRLAPKPRVCKPTLINSERLRKYVEEHPDAYLREIGEEFGATPQAVFYACKRLRISLKKRHPTIRNAMRQKEASSSRKLKRYPKKIGST